MLDFGKNKIIPNEEKMREYIAAVVMIAFTALCFWGMNQFGFQNNPHDILWSLEQGLRY